MRAATIADYSAEILITEVPKPDLAADPVLVEVHAAALNPIDSTVRAGYLKEMLPISFPYVMGYDLSGIVSEVGAVVKGFKVGDPVFARPNQVDSGSLAAYARVNEAELALKPRTISHAQAA
jgi:NADPH:quinone reductase-like Zn-dependent oxidoreductase